MGAGAVARRMSMSMLQASNIHAHSSDKHVAITIQPMIEALLHRHCVIAVAEPTVDLCRVQSRQRKNCNGIDQAMLFYDFWTIRLN